MRVRTFTVFAMAVVGLFGSSLSFSASTETDPTRPVSAPLVGSVAVPAAAEHARLDGTLAVHGTVKAAAGSEPAVLSYTCDSAGGARGETSGREFTVTGSEMGSVPVAQALPTDVGLSCSMTLVAGGLRQQFLITLQAAVDVNGTLTSLVIRTIAAL